MPNIVAIVSDDRVRRQVEQFIGEMGSSDIRLVTFKNAKEFESLYFPHLKGTRPAEEPKPEDGPVDMRLFSQVHMIVFAIDSINEKVPAWSAGIMKKTKERNYWPENNRTRLILLRYEDDTNNKSDLFLQQLDDLFYMPLDRLIFQQKVQIILGLPKKVKGNFLFNQPIEFEIEMSKASRMEKLSDIGLAVRNPLPIRSGIRAKFYMQLPGDKAPIRFFAKAVRSVPHPELPDQYLCYFTYFGVRKKEITRIRNFLAKTHNYKPLLKEDRSKFRLNPSDLMMTELAGPIRNIVVIDPADDQLSSISMLIRTELDHAQILTNSSYSAFIHKFIKHAASAALLKELPRPTRPEEMYGGNMSFQLTIDRRAIKKMSFTPGDEKFFGHTGKDTFKPGGVEWWSVFRTEENDLILQEAIVLLKENKQTNRVVVISSAEGGKVAVRLKVSEERDPELFKLEILPVSSNEMAEALGMLSELPTIDAMVIDAAFIPAAGFVDWIENLKNGAYQRGLVHHPNDLRVILTSDREDRLDRHWLDCDQVLGFLVKPVDGRQLLFLLAEALKTPFTAYTFDNVGWANSNIDVHMAREVHLEEVAEFGATIKTDAPFRPGSFFYLRKSIFDNAPDQCLASRVYYCEPHPKDRSKFQISVLYFGINESFLKFARNWIRDNYAHSKGQQG